jgi:C1A family cysteine protease
MTTHLLNCVPSTRHLEELGTTLDFTPTQARHADLRAYCPPIYDQGQLGSCTAFAIAKGLMEILYRIKGTPCPGLSALDLYYNERLQERDVLEDNGAQINDGLYAAKKRGVCPDSDDPYDITQFTHAPSAQATADEGRYRLGLTLRLNSLEAVKACLASGYPAVFGIQCFQGIQEVGPDGLMAMPRPGESPEGGHALTIVGYDDDRQVLIIRNSWGFEYGDEGYFYMPYAFADAYAYDTYTARL